MCIRDSRQPALSPFTRSFPKKNDLAKNGALLSENHYAFPPCLLYTSDAADERSSVDLGGRRIIKKKTKHNEENAIDIHKRDQKTNNTVLHYKIKR